METNNITKGKWHLSQNPCNRLKVIGLGRYVKSVKNKNPIDGKIIANAFGDGELEAIDNAKLITAAPEMLEALKIALTELRAARSLLSIEDRQIYPSKSVDIIEAVIEKATK